MDQGWIKDYWATTDADDSTQYFYTNMAAQYPDRYMISEYRTLDNGDIECHLFQREQIGTNVYTYYYAYSDWTIWSDEPAYESDTREVQTRTLYKYILN